MSSNTEESQFPMPVIATFFCRAINDVPPLICLPIKTLADPHNSRFPSPAPPGFISILVISSSTKSNYMAVTAGLSRWEPAFKMICAEKKKMCIARQRLFVCPPPAAGSRRRLCIQSGGLGKINITLDVCGSRPRRFFLICLSVNNK